MIFTRFIDSGYVSQEIWNFLTATTESQSRKGKRSVMTEQHISIASNLDVEEISDRDCDSIDKQSREFWERRGFSDVRGLHGCKSIENIRRFIVELSQELLEEHDTSLPSEQILNAPFRKDVTGRQWGESG